MIHFLIDDNEKTIVSMEVYVEHEMVQVKSKVNIRKYSEMLLRRSILSGAEQLVNDFEKINNYQDDLYTNHLKKAKDLKEEEINNEVKIFLKEIADRYNLNYIVD